MKKKGIIVLSSVVGVCALALVLSSVLDWSVDTQNTSGNIGKSSRFSRKTAEAGLSNMEELLQSDENYKNSMVSSYFIMQTRAEQFNALVNLSNEVAGDIPEFSSVLKDMNAIRPMINNVSASLAVAGNDLNASLGGESRPDLAQNTINASLAYTTLQKQNNLANRFIDTTDEYLKKSEGSDELKFVRDQWMNYQHMSAALENDTKSTEELKAKGYQLSPAQSAAALCGFAPQDVVGIIVSDCVANTLDVENSMAAIYTDDALNQIFTCINQTNEMVQMQTNEMVNMNTNDMVNMNTNDLPALNYGQFMNLNTNDMVNMNTNDLPALNFGKIVKLNTNDMVNMNTTDLPVMNFNGQIVGYTNVMNAFGGFAEFMGANPQSVNHDLTLGFGGQILELAGGHVTLSL